MLFEQTKVTGLFCFENRKTVFENVDSRFKFVVLSFEKGNATKNFPAAFMRHEVGELQNFPSYGASDISIDFIKRQSPDSLSVMEVKNEMEFVLAEKMLKFPMLKEEILDNWNIRLGNEFHMTGDSDLFRTNKENNSLTLYEGKMIHQFTSSFGKGKYWINESEGKKRLLGRSEDDGSILNYQRYRFVHRALAASTNERTMICTILSPNTFFAHSINSSINKIDYGDLLCIVGLMNSFCLDFYLRLTITTNLTMFYIYQLPVPRLSSKDKWYKPIIEKAAKLICTTEEFAELWEDVMKTKWSKALAATQESDRNKLRAELDGIIAHIYGLTEEEFTYILSTFPIVPQAQKQLALEQYQLIAAGKGLH